MDNVAFTGDKHGERKAEYVACVFARHSKDSRFVSAVERVADRLGLSEDDEDFATIQTRMVPFLQEILPGRQVSVLHGHCTQLTLSPGGRNGIGKRLQARARRSRGNAGADRGQRVAAGEDLLHPARRLGGSFLYEIESTAEAETHALQPFGRADE